MNSLREASDDAGNGSGALQIIAAGGALVATEAFKPGGAQSLVEKIEAEVRAVQTDISTPRGRDAVKSLAYKVARSKTALDAMGKQLTDEWRSRTDAVNADRRLVRERLDSLADEVRAPLTAWESREKARIAEHEKALADMVEAANYGLTETAVEIGERLAYLRSFPARDWGEFTQRAERVLADEIARTEALQAAALAREAEQAEMERLRAEEEERKRVEAERLQAEREARIAAEAAEAARIAAEERAAAEAKAAAERAAAERRAIEERAAAEAHDAEERAEAQRRAAAQAAREAEEREARIVARAAAERERAEQAQVAAERRAREAAEKAERDQAAAVEAERRRIAAAAAREREKAEGRAADRAHRGRINREAMAALVEVGVTEDVAKAIIGAVVAGRIPHVSVSY